MLKFIQRPLKSAFGSASKFSPSMSLASSDSFAKVSTFTVKATDRESQTSSDAFASSGFAALAGSATSPFGTLGGPSIAANASPFASAGFDSGKTEIETHEALKIGAASSSGFSTFVDSSSTGFSSPDQSPFGPSGSKKTSVFGGSVFGSTFGGPFGGGSRLTSFAAPTGDARLGVSNGAIKPIGSPKRDEDEDEHSDSEAEGAAESKKDEDIEEPDGRFQHQDGKRDCYDEGSKADREQWRLGRAAKIQSSLRERVCTHLGITLGKRVAREHLSSISLQHLQTTLLQTEKRAVL